MEDLKYGECVHHENLAQCEICNTDWNPEVPMPKIEGLLSLLALYGGKIVSTASLPSGFINQARVSGRMFVDDNALGFVWEPDIKMLPETEAEVEWFEKWYPLNSPVPEAINTYEKLKNWKRPENPSLDKEDGRATCPHKQTEVIEGIICCKDCGTSLGGGI